MRSCARPISRTCLVAQMMELIWHVRCILVCKRLQLLSQIGIMLASAAKCKTMILDPTGFATRITDHQTAFMDSILDMCHIPTQKEASAI
mmetsp:Transcript_10176/g.21548  ORF Transcript_10176/g.21548 Transcript_10176/m.21548 type:complete len:90 (-) Transcript_10176:295-564(-)